VFVYETYSYFIVASFQLRPQDGIDYMRTLLRRLWKEDIGQDLLEYALLAGFIVVVVAGFLPPAVMPAVSTIFSKITGIMGLS
jgi:Flp pilus assembly pilin Flp